MTPKTAPTTHTANMEILRHGLLVSVFHTFEECGIQNIHPTPLHAAVGHCLKRFDEEGQNSSVFGLKKDPVTKEFPEVNAFLDDSVRKGRLKERRVSSGVPGIPMLQVYCMADGFYSEANKVEQAEVMGKELRAVVRKVSGCLMGEYGRSLKEEAARLAKQAPPTDLELVSTAEDPLVLVPRRRTRK